jgi:DNA-binding transcriptional regulator YiaG
MKYLTMLVLILITALFVFGAGFFWFVQRITPETIALNQETAKLRAETEKLTAEQNLVNTKLAAYTKQQDLKNEQVIKSTGAYRYSLAAAYAVQNLWFVWLLLSVLAVAYHQRTRFEPQVTFKAEGIETLVPAKNAEPLVKEALEVVKLRHSEEILALSDDRAGVRLRENVQAIRALKSLVKDPKTVEPMQAVDITPAIPARSQTFSLSDLLLDPDLERGTLPLGRNTESGACVQVDPLFATSFDIIGKPNNCKTTLLKMIVGGFLKLQDEGQAIDLHLIDPHAGLPESLATFLKPILNRFKATILGEQAIEEGDHLALLETLESEAVNRQEQGYNTPLQVLIIDEIHDILDQEGGKDTYALLKKLRRLRKAGFFQAIVWHDSTKEGQAGLGTGLMGLNVSAFVVNSTKSKAAKVLESEDADKAVNLPKGQAVLKLPGVDSELVNIPVVRDADLLPFIQQKTTPAALTTADNDPDISGQGFNLKAIREGAGLSQNMLAKLSGIYQVKLSRVEAGDVKLSDEEMNTIQSVIAEYLTTQNDNVIALNSYRKA